MSIPVCCSWFSVSGSGPNEDCSRKRSATAALTGFPTEITATVTDPDVPPPGAGFVTITGTFIPACGAVTVPIAVIIVDVTYVTFSGAPPNVAVDVATNPV